MNGILSRSVPFLVIILLTGTLIAYVTGWSPLFFPKANLYSHVARSIPRDPGALRWEISDSGMLHGNGASISFSTGTLGDELLTFYTEEMPQNGWEYVDEQRQYSNLFDYHAITFAKQFSGRTYYARIPVNIHKRGRGVSDNTISVSDVQHFGGELTSEVKQ